MSGPIFHNFSAAPQHVAPFSHAVECDGWIQLTGQMPTNPDQGDLLANGLTQPAPSKAEPPRSTAQTDTYLDSRDDYL